MLYAGATIKTTGVIESKVSYKEIFTLIKNRYDSKAKYRNEKCVIKFDYFNSKRELFIAKFKNDRFPIKEYNFLSNNDYIKIWLPEWEGSVEIIKDILSVYGGWIEESNYNDNKEFYQVKKKID